ncbi:hypothetical protein [Granulicella aggregans]|uniref:hypothetical protein n=1 Tax=Granulicella aggregans TaxID=474949 RepID=UPI0021DF7FB4|nr:hypothetical protein [Granulicella aggregans]
MPFPEKSAWVLLLICFATLEIYAIKRSDKENKDIRDAQNATFNDIVEKLKISTKESKDQYNSTITHVDGVLETTRQVSNLTKDALESVTSGDVYAYLDFELADDPTLVEFVAVRRGKYPVRNLEIRFSDASKYKQLMSPLPKSSDYIDQEQWGKAMDASMQRATAGSTNTFHVPDFARPRKGLGFFYPLPGGDSWEANMTISAFNYTGWIERVEFKKVQGKWARALVVEDDKGIERVIQIDRNYPKKNGILDVSWPHPERGLAVWDRLRSR